MKQSLLVICVTGLLGTSPLAAQDKIVFADENVKSVCVEKWDTDGDGELSTEEAAAVSELGTAFSFNSAITSFEELSYFVGLSEIGTYAFYKCYNLRSVTVPEGVTRLGKGVFFDCNSLSEISLPANLVSIGEYAFDACHSISEMKVPEGVKDIGEFAFSYCSGLKRFSLPSTVTSMASNALSNCYYLEAISVDPANTAYDSREDCNAIVETKSNTLVIGCMNTVIPSSVRTIGIGAFTGCQGLTSIVVPQGVTTIDERAFTSCGYMTDVSLPTTLKTIGAGAFWGCSSLTSVVVPYGVTSIGSSAFKSCYKLASVYLPSSLTKMGTDVFYDSPVLSSVTVGFASPITITEATFPNRKKAVLYVPRGSKREFLTAVGWKDFHSIVEIDHEDIHVSLEPQDISTYLGGMCQLAVGLTNDAMLSYDSFQMDIMLPDGFSVLPGTVALSSRCGEMEAEVTLSGNTFRIASPTNHTSIEGTEGTLFSIGIVMDDSVVPGEYHGSITGAVFTSGDGACVQADDTTFAISVSEFGVGDVNHDGNVNVADVMLAINYVMGNNPSAFYADKGDVNGDGQINITDVMCIVKIIMGDNSM